MSGWDASYALECGCCPCCGCDCDAEPEPEFDPSDSPIFIGPRLPFGGYTRMDEVLRASYVPYIQKLLSQPSPVLDFIRRS